MPTQQQIADAIAQKARQVAYKGQLFDDDVVQINNLAAVLYKKFLTAPTPVVTPTAVAAVVGGDPLTLRAALELAGHESIVLESYKDNSQPPVWTWGIGVTNASGYDVMQYIDNPQTVQHVIDIFVNRLRKVYIPGVLKAFAGHALTEAQFAAALSFHYNTGAIGHTDWVGDYLAGRTSAARTFWESHYLGGGKDRRVAEAALFFDGKWTGNGYTTIWPVKKPSHTPDWAHPQRVDVRSEMAQALAA
jgi:GH24 family phage-related lysozyme (muramidase)